MLKYILKLLKIVPIVIIFNLIISVNSSAIEIDNLSQAVNIAGKQRMFTQRMLKDYVMIGLKNKFSNPKKDLKKVVSSFDDHLISLINFNKKNKTDKSLKKVKKLWIIVKASLRRTPKKEDALKIQENLEKLLKESSISTHLFVKQTGKSSGKIIDISGKQRMLSQRMAGLYMLKVWGLNNQNITEKMNDAIKTFKKASKILMKSSLNTDKITHLLKKSDRSLMFLEMMSKSKTKFIPSLIYKKSNDILRDMNKATELYVLQKNK